MTGKLRIALSKGRLFAPSVDLLARAGIRISEDGSRRLIFSDRDKLFEFIALKPIDIPVYVESGAIHAGIVGSDIIRELESDVYEPLDLQIGKCKLSLAAPNDTHLSLDGHPRIATKYPRTAERFFKARNAHVQIVTLEGSVEIAPLLGLADGIIDLVETGRTLRDNGMRIIEDISPVSAKLIVNRTAMKIKATDSGQLISHLDAVVYAKH
jgi:ATP phosphoribosyltransferase